MKWGLIEFNGEFKNGAYGELTTPALFFLEKSKKKILSPPLSRARFPSDIGGVGVLFFACFGFCEKIF